MSEIQSLTLRAQDLTRSVDWWNTAMVWGLAIAAIAAVFVLISTRVVVAKAKELSQVQDQLGEAKGKQLAVDLKAKDTQIELAKKGAAEATATAKGFESKIAESDARAKSAEAQVASAMARSDEAVATVKTADARIAEAQRDAARANETAERERLARIQLEARLAPRSLTPEDQRRVTAGLTPFAGTIIDIATFGDATEITGISRQIIEAIGNARWVVHPVTAMAGQAEVRGILIGTSAASDPAIARAAEALIRLLQPSVAIGPWPFDQMPFPGNFFGEQGVTHNAAIRLFIGSKP